MLGLGRDRPGVSTLLGMPAAKQKTRWASAKRVSCAPPDIFGLERTSL
jgi:hypothetical protein